MRSGALVATVAVLLAASSASAFDAAEADIVGLRLGMAESDILNKLRRQGFAVAHEHGALTARTRDGQLTIDLSPERAADRIRYVFVGNGPGEPGKIEAAILDRFGPPAQTKPMVWCHAVGQDGTCPKRQASLTFLPNKLTLELQAATEAP